MRRRHFIAMAVLFLGAAGCGNGLKHVPVQGKITARGVPLDGATVQFVPTDETKGQGALGYSDAEGNFTLTDYSPGGGKGIAPGKYKVRLLRRLAADGTPLPAGAAETPDSKESLPREYTSLADTPLTATIPETGGAVNLDIPVKVLRRK